MGWTTSAPSGYGSYSAVGSKTVSGNNFSATMDVAVARGSTNNVAIRIKVTSGYGAGGTYVRPGSTGFNTSATSSGCYTRTFPTSAGGSNYTYWTGTLNKNSTMYVYWGFTYDGTSFSGFDSSSRMQVTGPAYTTTYTITYNGNGSTSGSTASQTKTYGDSVTLRANGFTRTGYTFNGWNTASDGSGTNYAAGASYSANANLTLYAKWSVITYTVSFDGNGADGGSTAAQTKTYGAALELADNGFTRTGYTFAEWNTAADGTGTGYAEGDSYVTNAAVTFYAIWKKNNIPVFINAGGTIVQAEKAYININGTIKECAVYLNANGTIRLLE